MNKTHRDRVLAIAAMMLAFGCGKPEQSTADKLVENEADVNLVEDMTGINENTKVAIEQDTEEQAGASQAGPSGDGSGDSTVIGGSQGAFVGIMKLGGKEVNGTFNVLKADATGEIVVKGAKSGKEVRLDPGNYDFVFMTDAIVGEPEFTLRDVEILAGRRLSRDVNVPVGKITLVTGAKCARKSIKIRLKGATDWYKGKFSTCQELTLMAGEYDAQMGDNKNATVISGIQVYDGGVRDVLIRQQ